MKKQVERKQSASPKSTWANEGRYTPGKASPSARWRRVRALAEQAVQFAGAGDLERTKSTVEAILAIASQAIRELEQSAS
ncbi:MAG: hypothetical protein NZ899_12535 [Thermoguttaceae bacterium]|nr:hypothetical protein [Thermoguttaceae bacterium]MDW8079927.1 hypothetical protein [Thermoguttaceae bacterium]